MRSHLILALFALIFIAAPSTAAEPAGSLDIYVVRGDADQLARFQSEVGNGWQGGKFLERLSSRTEYRYWAYPSRTAGEARTFMFGSISRGLRYDIEAYGEATYYPAERALLNGIISRCALKSDPFFIEPDRTLLLKPEAEEKSATARCIRTELNKTNFGHDMPVKLLGNEDPSERG